jgi:hypothetical protein
MPADEYILRPTKKFIKTILLYTYNFRLYAFGLYMRTRTRSNYHAKKAKSTIYFFECYDSQSTLSALVGP